MNDNQPAWNESHIRECLDKASVSKWQRGAQAIRIESYIDHVAACLAEIDRLRQEAKTMKAKFDECAAFADELCNTYLGGPV